MRIELEIGIGKGRRGISRRRFDGFAFTNCGSVVIVGTGDQVAEENFLEANFKFYANARDERVSKGVDRT